MTLGSSSGGVSVGNVKSTGVSLGSTGSVGSVGSGSSYVYLDRPLCSGSGISDENLDANDPTAIVYLHSKNYYFCSLDYLIKLHNRYLFRNYL